MSIKYMKNIKSSLPFHDINELKFWLSSLDKKRTLTIVLCAIFVILAISLVLPKSTKLTNDKNADLSEEDVQNVQLLYEEKLEQRVNGLLQEIDGVGESQTLVTIESGEYKMFAKDSYEDKNGNKYEYVIVNGKSGSDEGLCVNVIAPKVRGVAVVCEGGDSAVVKAAVIATISSVLGINSTQISVSKMK